MFHGAEVGVDVGVEVVVGLVGQGGVVNLLKFKINLI